MNWQYEINSILTIISFLFYTSAAYNLQCCHTWRQSMSRWYHILRPVRCRNNVTYRRESSYFTSLAILSRLKYSFIDSHYWLKSQDTSSQRSMQGKRPISCRATLCLVVKAREHSSRIRQPAGSDTVSHPLAWKSDDLPLDRHRKSLRGYLRESLRERRERKPEPERAWERR